jgi:protein-S-isoprenylcysteine O-methyltransferase Ste14
MMAQSSYQQVSSTGGHTSLLTQLSCTEDACVQSQIVCSIVICLLCFAMLCDADADADADWLEVRFGDLMVVIIQVMVFWSVTPHGLHGLAG